MRTELLKRSVELQALKPIRRKMTDAIQNMDPGQWSYKKYTDLAYKLVTGKIARQLRTERGAAPKASAVEYLSAEEIHALKETEYKIGVLLETGFDYGQIKTALSGKRVPVRAGH
jgi:hypothetical protein